jgi:hypothetical protein
MPPFAGHSWAHRLSFEVARRIPDGIDLWLISRRFCASSFKQSKAHVGAGYEAGEF